jgi:hypothetical protein
MVSFVVAMLAPMKMVHLPPPIGKRAIDLANAVIEACLTMPAWRDRVSADQMARPHKNLSKGG